ncbi:MAG: Hsp20/alpha crystallin family protein [Chloroflexi bacterium]|nr:Hsp20/alpha crystallin family protein [Chloroflexota bacterium]
MRAVSGPLLFVVREVWHPPTDVYETDEELVVMLDLAAVSQDDLEIAIEDNVLHVRGRRQEPFPSNKISVYRMEIPYGDFEAHIHLPVRIVRDEVQASYENGILAADLAPARRRGLSGDVRPAHREHRSRRKAHR